MRRPHRPHHQRALTWGGPAAPSALRHRGTRRSVSDCLSRHSLRPHFAIWVWSERRIGLRSAARGAFLSHGSERCDILAPRAAVLTMKKQSRSKKSTRSQLCSFKPLPGNPQPDRQKCQNEEGRLTKIVLGLRLAVLIIASRGAPWLLAGVCALHRSRLCEIGSVCQVCGQPRVRFSLFR